MSDHGGPPAEDDGSARRLTVARRDLHVHAHRGRGGRRRDHEATARVVAATQSLLAERGAAISVEAVATRAGVGKATIYRRWSTSTGLVADAVMATEPLPAAPDTAEDARTLLMSLLQRLTEALVPAELTVAAALSQATWEPELRRATEHILLVPLRTRMREACLLSGTPDDQTLAASVALVEGLWLRRYLRTAPHRSSPTPRSRRSSTTSC